MTPELDSWMGGGSFRSPLVRVIVAPSFKPHVEYAAFSTGASKVVVERQVGRVMPSETLQDPSTLEGAEAIPDGPPASCDRAMIDESEFVLVCAWLGVPLPPMPTRSSMGLDGTTFEVVLGHWPTRVQYRWWEEVPEGWEPLGNFLREFTQLVDRSVGPHGEY